MVLGRKNKIGHEAWTKVLSLMQAACIVCRCNLLYSVQSMQFIFDVTLPHTQIKIFEPVDSWTWKIVASDIIEATGTPFEICFQLGFLDWNPAEFDSRCIMPRGTHAKVRSEVGAHLLFQPGAACATRVERRRKSNHWKCAQYGFKRMDFLL